MDSIRKLCTCFFLLSIILGAFLIQHSACKKEILKEANCFEFFDGSIHEPGINARWSGNVERKTCEICNPSKDPKKSWLLTKFVNVKEYKLFHVDVDIFTRTCVECKNPNLSVYLLYKNQVPSNDDDAQTQFIKVLKTLPFLATLSNTKDEFTETRHFQFEPTQSQFSLVMLSEGSCTQIKNIVISSFVCERNVSSGVNLPRTVAPARGVERVNASCPENTLNPGKEEAYGLCSSNGLWKSIVSPCMRKKGFTLATIKEGCEECPKNTYKDIVGNHKCIPCPVNSVRQDAGQFYCQCREGFYRFIGQNFSQQCYGVPSPVTKIQDRDRTETMVTLQWEPPSVTHGQGVLYDIECNKCQSGGDNGRSFVGPKPCGDNVKYSPSQLNLKDTKVIVEQLDQNTEYMFVIYSKNNNSEHINMTYWSKVLKKIKTEGASTSSGLPIVIVIAVPVIVVILIVVILKTLQNENQSREDLCASFRTRFQPSSSQSFTLTQDEYTAARNDTKDDSPTSAMEENASIFSNALVLVGIIVGGIVFLILLAGIVIYFVCGRKSMKSRATVQTESAVNYNCNYTAVNLNETERV